jgi:hypothetical protein
LDLAWSVASLSAARRIDCSNFKQLSEQDRGVRDTLLKAPFPEPSRVTGDDPRVHISRKVYGSPPVLLCCESVKRGGAWPPRSDQQTIRISASNRLDASADGRTRSSLKKKSEAIQPTLAGRKRYLAPRFTP